MDATRPRRTKDRARRAWYASRRQQRFAYRLGFPQHDKNRAPAVAPWVNRLSGGRR